MVVFVCCAHTDELFCELCYIMCDFEFKLLCACMLPTNIVMIFGAEVMPLPVIPTPCFKMHLLHELQEC
jgi:hypothetical protein